MSNLDKDNNTDNRGFFIKLFTGLFATFVCVSAVLSGVVAYFVSHALTITPDQYITGGIITLIIYSAIFITALIILNNKSEKDNRQQTQSIIEALKLESSKQIDLFNKSAQTSLSKTQTALDDDILNLEKIAERLSSDQHRLIETLEKKEFEMVKSIVDRSILGENAVLALEGSVGNSEGDRHPRIYIQSSEFTLEKISLLDTIVWNLRKGCKYIYIIPDTEGKRLNYIDVVTGWYKKYVAFFVSKKKFEEEERALSVKYEFKRYWNEKYLSYYKQAKELWKNDKYTEEQRRTERDSLLKKVNELFSSLVETHLDAESSFFITVALYQGCIESEGSKPTDRAIIKLPTIKKETNYLAYEIHAENRSEFKQFEDKFTRRFFDSKQLIVKENYSICQLFEPEIPNEV